MLTFLFQHFQFQTQNVLPNFFLQKVKLTQNSSVLHKTSKSANKLKVLQSNVETGICQFPPIHLSFKESSKNTGKL